MADQEGLQLKDAIERAVGPLTQLFAAAAAWFPVKWDYLARQGAGQPPNPEHECLYRAFAREWEARVGPFLRLLAVGEWIVEIRPLNKLGAPRRRLRPDEAGELRIEGDLYDPNALLLRGPRRQRLYGLFFPAPRTSEPPHAGPVKKAWRNHPTKLELSAAMKEIERDYPPGAHPSENEIWDKLKARWPTLPRQSARDALANSRLKGERGRRSKA
jgi:hypothetical protein